MPRIEWVSDPPQVITKVSVKPTIHNVFILDTSSSMSQQDRFKNAKKALLEQMTELRKNTEVDYTFSILQFSDADKIEFIMQKSQSSGIPIFKNPNGWTALNDAIGYAVNTFIKDDAIGSDQVVFKIFTDGEENSSKKFSKKDIGILLSEIQKDRGWVVTFIGTESDVKEATKIYSIDASNTLVHNNTGDDISRAIDYDTRSTVNYSKRIIQGDLSNTEFYNQ